MPYSSIAKVSSQHDDATISHKETQTLRCSTLKCSMPASRTPSRAAGSSSFHGDTHWRPYRCCGHLLMNRPPIFVPSCIRCLVPSLPEVGHSPKHLVKSSACLPATNVSLFGPVPLGRRGLPAVFPHTADLPSLLCGPCPLKSWSMPASSALRPSPRRSTNHTDLGSRLLLAASAIRTRPRCSSFILASVPAGTSSRSPRLLRASATGANSLFFWKG